MDTLRLLREWLQRLLGALHLSRRDSDLEEELRLHLELAAEQEGASRTARIKAGNEAQAMELLRDQRGLPWLEDLVRDLYHSLRMVRPAPAFAVVATLTLALGIGANTAIFSIVNGVLLRPLRYSRPAQLTYLNTRFPELGFRQFPASVAEYLELQQFNRSFADVGAFRTGEVNLATGDRTLGIRAATVDSHLLHTLDVQAAEGRLFTGQETGLAGVAPVAMISDELWQRVFGAQPVVGHSVEVDGRRLQIVGVMARGADLMDEHAQIWLPLNFTDSERGERNNHNLSLIGRLKEGVTAASAQGELKALLASWGARAGITPGLGHAGHVFLPTAKGRDGHSFQMTPLAEQVLGRASRSIWMLQAAVGLVLLVACANTLNLLLARGETRHREFALLTALGASRGRLLRKAMTESMALSVAGSALGVLLAGFILEALVHTYPASLPRIGEASVDLRVMLVSLATASGCGLLFGLIPMMHTRAEDTAEALKSASRGSAGTTRHRVGRALVIAETGLAAIVVVGAGLLLRTVHNLNAVDAGFDRSRLVTFSITLPPAGHDFAGRVRTYQSLLERLRSVPGIDMATAMTGLPLETPLSSYQTEIVNHTATSEPPIPAIHSYQRVMSGYFETMGIPILQGRGFQPIDAASQGMTALVNETLAKRYWKGRSPLGQRLRLYSTNNASPWFTVIGVAKDVKQSGVDQPAGTEVYLLIDQLATDSPTTWAAIPPTSMHVVLRTTLPAATLAPTIARIARDIDGSVSVARVREMGEVIAESIRRPRLLAQLLAAFSALALLLAAIGTYGVLTYMVAERRREIGIRMALGAGRERILADVVKEGLQLTTAGMVLGTRSAVILNRLMASLLFGVGPTDATTFAITIPTIAVIACAACALPAWRASRLDPNVVLRAE